MKVSGDRNNNEPIVDGGSGVYRQISSPPARRASSSASSSSAIALSRSSTLPLPPGRKYLHVRLLSGHKLLLSVQSGELVGRVLGFVCGELGVEDARLLGLAQLRDGEPFFLDAATRLSKIAPKNWRSQHGSGTDHAGSPLLCLELRVEIFVDFVRLMSCPVALEMYYLELRTKARVLWTSDQDIPEERCWEIAALALQADFGDFAAEPRPAAYFDAALYFPSWVLERRGVAYVERHAPTVHGDLSGLDRREARVRFCREVSRSPCPVNLHLYGIRRLKGDAADNALFVVATRGLMLLDLLPIDGPRHIGQPRRRLAYSFAWNHISKLSFHKRRLSIVSVEGKKLSYFTSSDEKSRYLLAFARSVHQRTMALQAHLRDACTLELSERRRFRESYIWSDAEELATLRSAEGVGVSGGEGRQRVSVVSEASSGTTSGIVSERGGEEEERRPAFRSEASLGLGSSRGGSSDLLAGATDPRLHELASRAEEAISTQVTALLAASRSSLAVSSLVTSATQTDSGTSPSPPPTPTKSVTLATQTSPHAHSATVLTVNDVEPPPPPLVDRTLSCQDLAQPPAYAAAVHRRDKRWTTVGGIDPASLVEAADLQARSSQHLPAPAATGYYRKARKVSSGGGGIGRVQSMGRAEPELEAPPPYPGLSHSTTALDHHHCPRHKEARSYCADCSRDHTLGSGRINMALVKDYLSQQSRQFPLIYALAREAEAKRPDSDDAARPRSWQENTFPGLVLESGLVGVGATSHRVLQPSTQQNAALRQPDVQDHRAFEISSVAADVTDGGRFNSTPNLSGCEVILPPPPYPCRPAPGGVYYPYDHGPATLLR